MIRTSLTLTPAAGGAATVLPAPDTVETDAAGNITFGFTDPLADHRSALAKLVCRNVEQHRNRAAAYLAVADPGGRLVLAEWADLLVWNATGRPQSEVGALTLPSYRVTGVREEGFTLVLYRANALYARGTGVIERA